MWSGINSLQHTENTPESVAVVKRLLTKLEQYNANFNKYWLPYPIRPYQYEKLQKVLQGFLDQRNARIEEKVIGDITPPAGWKTYMIAILAKLMLEEGIPTIISTYNSTAIFGEDNTRKLLEKMFGKESIGVINAAHKQIDKDIVITTPQALVNNAEYFANTHKRLNIILDEWDVFQTELRQESIDILSRPNNFLSLYSATKVVSGRNVENRANIVDEMPLTKLIDLGYAKHIEGIYYMGDLTITDQNIEQNGLDYNSLKAVEQKFMIDSAFDLYTKNHKGQKCIIHGWSAKQLTDMCKKFTEQWYKAEYVTYATPDKKRRAIEEAYINGDLDILVGQAIYGRAFSEKWVTQVEIFAHVTGSATHLYQSILRGWRPNEKFDTLTIYQLLPSTLSTKSFVPIFMHDCFNVPLEDMGYWKNSDEAEKPNTPKKPIVFRQKSSEEPTQKEDKKATSIIEKPTVTFASIIDLKKVIDTRASYEAKLLYYVRENFVELVDEFLKINSFFIQDIRKIDGPIAQTVMRVININGTDENLTWHKVRMSVFSLITGEAKMYGRHNVSLIDNFIQERYTTGKIPLFNARKEALDIKKAPSKKKEPVRKELLQKNAIDIFNLFIAEHAMKESDLPRNLSDRSIQYHEVICKFNYFLSSILQGVTWYAPKLCNGHRNVSWKMMRDWKNSWQEPDSAALRTEVIKKAFDDTEYIIRRFEKIIDLFLLNNNLKREDIPYFNLKLHDTVSLTIDAEEMKKYYKHMGESAEFIDTIPADFVYTPQYRWHDILGRMTNYYCSEKIKAIRDANDPMQKEYRTNNNASLIVQKQLEGELDSDTLRDLLTIPPATTLPLAEEFMLTKNINTILVANDTIFDDISKLKWSNFSQKSLTFKVRNVEENISGQRLCFVVTRCLAQTDVKDLAASLGFTTPFETNKMSLEIFKKYISLLPSERKSFTRDALVAYIDSIKSNITGSTKEDDEVTDVVPSVPTDKELRKQIKMPTDINQKIAEILKNINAEQYDRRKFYTIKRALSDGIFPDIETLNSFWLNLALYKKLKQLLDDEEREDELMEDTKMKNFFEVRVLEKMWK